MFQPIQVLFDKNPAVEFEKTQSQLKTPQKKTPFLKKNVSFFSAPSGQVQRCHKSLPPWKLHGLDRLDSLVGGIDLEISGPFKSKKDVTYNGWAQQNQWNKWGEVITSISRVKFSTQWNLFSYFRPFIGAPCHSIYNDLLGAHLVQMGDSERCFSVSEERFVLWFGWWTKNIDDEKTKTLRCMMMSCDHDIPHDLISCIKWYQDLAQQYTTPFIGNAGLPAETNNSPKKTSMLRRPSMLDIQSTGLRAEAGWFVTNICEHAHSTDPWDCLVYLPIHWSHTKKINHSWIGKYAMPVPWILWVRFKHHLCQGRSTPIISHILGDKLINPSP